MDIKNLIIQAEASMGKRPLLVDISPYYEYKNNQRTDKILGYRYDVAMPEHSLDKIGVKIEGKQLLSKPNGFVEVKFSGLEMMLYTINGHTDVKATAKGIEVVSKG